MSEDAQAAVSVVSGLDEARARLSEILRAEGARSVVVSPAAAGEPWAVLPAVEADGRHALQRTPGTPARGDLLAADAGVTVAAFAIADTGTVALVASPGDHRLDSLLPPVHVALVRAGTLVPDLGAAIARLDAARTALDHSAIVFVRGPSRTADIELTLTVGVHGPGRAHVIIAD
jgi:L-lactate dehydrogenase complex protein LldG